MEQRTEWTFEGSLERGFPKYGLTASAAVIRAAYMLVYGRVDFF